MQQFKLLRHEHFAQGCNAGYISSRSVEAGDKAELDRVAAGIENNRNRRGRRLGGACCCNAGCDDDRHLTPHQIGYHHRQPFVLALCPTEFDFYVAALTEAGLVKAFAECGHQGSVFVAVSYTHLTLPTNREV